MAKVATFRGGGLLKRPAPASPQRKEPMYVTQTPRIIVGFSSASSAIFLHLPNFT